MSKRRSPQARRRKSPKRIKGGRTAEFTYKMEILTDIRNAKDVEEIMKSYEKFKMYINGLPERIIETDFGRDIPGEKNEKYGRMVVHLAKVSYEVASFQIVQGKRGWTSSEFDKVYIYVRIHMTHISLKNDDPEYKYEEQLQLKAVSLLKRNAKEFTGWPKSTWTRSWILNF